MYFITFFTDISWSEIGLENIADRVCEVLEVLQKYVPFASHENERIYTEQCIVGDQLSFERALNCVLRMSNGYTPEERVSGKKFLQFAIVPYC